MNFSKKQPMMEMVQYVTQMKYSYPLDKLTRYASYEVCPYIIGKVPSDVEGEVIANAVKKLFVVLLHIQRMKNPQ